MMHGENHIKFTSCVCYMDVKKLCVGLWSRIFLSFRLWNSFNLY